MKKNISFVCLIACTFIWGTTFIAQDTGMDNIGPFTFNCVRFFVGFLAVSPFVFFFERKKITKLCRELKIDKKEFFGGSITISSLGSIGGSFFTPIINQPEVAILGVGKAEMKQVFMGDKYENRIMLPLSLSYDHRVIDGAEGARFCSHLRESLGKDFAYKLAV